MSIQTEHTPLPWEVVEATENHGPYITTAFGTTVCDLYAMTDPHSNGAILRGETKARSISHTDADVNARLIVLAVNAYDDMLEALHEISNINAKYGSSLDTDTMRRVHAAIAKARHVRAAQPAA